MRFGIMEMQLDRLIPRENNGENIVEQILNFDRSHLVSGLVQAGFNLVELGGDLGLFFPNAYGSENIQRLLNLKKDHALTFTVHLPLWSVEPSTPLESVRLGSVDAIMDVIDAVQPLNPEAYVLHATGALAAEFYRMKLPPVTKELVLKQFQGSAINSIKLLLEETGLSPRKLAIETIEFPLNLTLEIAELLDLSICFDTGHVLAGFSGPMAFEEALDACLSRLAEVHLHDSPNFINTGKLGYGKDHQPLGSGDLDIQNFFKKLIARNFDGPIIFELTIAQAQASMNYLQKHGGLA
ncbi:MAG: cobamide remodeling phosphodiesterase CbiR [Anaerolineales bacterium]